MLGCAHYLCFQCQVGNASCKLCNVKEEYGNLMCDLDVLKLSCSCLIPKKYIVNHILSQTNDQIFCLESDSDVNIYPYCFCMKRLSESDMQVLFKKEMYDRVRFLKHEAEKSKPQRIYTLVDEQGYDTKHLINIYCKDSDIINNRDISIALQQNKNIKSICVREGDVTEGVVKAIAALASKLQTLTSLSFKDVAMSREVLLLVAEAFGDVRVGKLAMKNVRLDSQVIFESVGKLMHQTKAQCVELKNVGMNDYGLIYFAEYIPKAEGLKDLDISYNKLTKVGLKCIEDLLKDNNQHLKSLKLKQERAEQSYYDSIRSLRTSIKAIEIEAF
eukprot:TRINITY_DN3483_c0_g1_i9.p1 TRINITY_DN3483_c0_g1~~TRINITY_DN3483_c0_g1_i9.p1  ORF type:complete len:367 (-),score=77.49 TRINITY_DN3483_c0_g1_i9:191-1180(-)